MSDSANQQVSPQLQQFILQEQAKAQVNKSTAAWPVFEEFNCFLEQRCLMSCW